ncbi:MAG: tRNA (adenosine(37)-N6)-threonylcarbamoyltransferase complex transferase subunit TsaD, partial [Nanoarchaeota archaeon]|nr:tRNA (adenosine(37)-N6)-threonylcarbamoyltransferase complex transferase subunit TsaD [Nanoarchaeota archaeon]
MIILGIETSCDDTGISVIKVSEKKRPVFEILSNVVSSQIKTHAPFGGVVPNLAAREHLKNIEPCLKTALKEANKTISEIDLIAVTYGPGLIPSLLIGVNFA